MTILEKIIRYKKAEVQKAKERHPQAVLETQISNNKFPANRLLEKLQNIPNFHLICEIKKASPSQGIIQNNFKPIQRAITYEGSGASAISVLTDEKFFQGHLDYLTQVKTAVTIPVLRKDFIIDKYQIYETKAYGADIILLIARILDPKKIAAFSHLALKLNMDVLLEISQETEINMIPTDIPLVIGINNRDLSDFSVDLNRSIRIKNKLPSHLPAISESGINTSTDCQLLMTHGFRGALIGEALMRTQNPQSMIKNLMRDVNRVYQT